jgi:hypothetical protein
MTEKALNNIGLGVSAVLSVGVDYVVDKAITKAVNPKTIPEKILTGIGIVGVDIACDYAIWKMINTVLAPSEAAKYEALVNDNIAGIQANGEVMTELAKHTVRIEDMVGDVYKKMMEVSNGSGSD